MSVSQKTDGRWAVVHYVDGKQHWVYFGRGVEAEKTAREHDAALKATGEVRTYKKRSRTFGPTFTELADAYLKSKAATLPRVSIQNTRYKLQGVILPYLGHLKAMALKPETLDRYITKRAKDVKMTTIHRELSDVQAILNWSVRRRLIPLNPVHAYEKPKRDDAIIRPPTMGEIRTVLSHAPDHLKRALTISYYTGLRPGNAELFGLTWGEVDLENDLIHITSAQKNGLRHRSVPLHPSFKLQLERWHHDDGGNGHLIRYRGQPISSIKTAWTNTKAKAKIKRRMRLYDFRHAFASAMLTSGGDLKATSELLGHTRTDTTTRVYQHTDATLHRRNIDRLPDID